MPQYLILFLSLSQKATAAKSIWCLLSERAGILTWWISLHISVGCADRTPILHSLQVNHIK